MSPQPQPHPSEPSRLLTANNATRLLRTGLAQPRRPIDAVLERLAEPDGTDWLESAISAVTGISAGAWTAAGEGFPSIEALNSAKDMAKKAMAAARTTSGVAAATASYFVAVSAAIARHGRAISSQPPSDLAGPIAELAAVAPEPWGGLLQDAARRLAP